MYSRHKQLLGTSLIHFLAYYSLDLFQDFAPLNWGDEMSKHPRLPSERKQSWIALLERAAIWQGPNFPLNGQDVKALGIEPGPQIGKLLSLVEDWWESGRYKANRQDCLDRLFDEANRL